MSITRWLAVVWMACASAALAHAQESRVALVIGNSNYAAVSPLANPLRDARAVANAFHELGFKTVQLSSNLTRDGIIRALQIFEAEAERADWAVIYYAGHGIEVDRQNYIIPVDAQLKTDKRVADEAVPLDRVISAIEGAKKLRLVILDACRDNPFLASMQRTRASRSIGRGLASVEPEGGTLVAFAAKEGQIAFDGSGVNSPFVAALLKHLETPGLEINMLFRQVRSDVLKATAGRQEPFIYGSLPPESFYFKAVAALQAPSPTPALSAAPGAQPGPAGLLSPDKGTGGSVIAPPQPLLETVGKPAEINAPAAPQVGSVAAPAVAEPPAPGAAGIALPSADRPAAPLPAAPPPAPKAAALPSGDIPTEQATPARARPAPPLSAPRVAPAPPVHTAPRAPAPSRKAALPDQPAASERRLRQEPAETVRTRQPVRVAPRERTAPVPAPRGAAVATPAPSRVYFYDNGNSGDSGGGGGGSSGGGGPPGGD